MASRGRKGGAEPGNYASDYERSLMQRILSETTEYPLEFRNWLKRFIQDTTSDSLLEDGGGPGDTAGFNPKVWMPGIIVPFATSTAPPHSLACLGQDVSRVTYAALFSVIHTDWGAGDGTTTFTLPDFRGRALYGVGGAGALAAHDSHAVATRGASHHHLFGRQNQALQGGVTQYAVIGDGSTVDRNTTGGTPVDSPGWAVATYLITTGVIS